MSDQFNTGVLDEIAPDIVVVTDAISLRNQEEVYGRVIKFGSVRTVNFKESDKGAGGPVDYVDIYFFVDKFVGRDERMRAVERPHLQGPQVVSVRKDKMGPFVALNGKLKASSGDKDIICKRKLYIYRVDTPNTSGVGSYMTINVEDQGADDRWHDFDTNSVEFKQIDEDRGHDENRGSAANENLKELLKKESDKLNSATTIKQLTEIATESAKLYPDIKAELVSVFHEKKAALAVEIVKSAPDPVEKAKEIASKIYKSEPIRAQDLISFAEALAASASRDELLEDDVNF